LASVGYCVIRTIFSCPQGVDEAVPTPNLDATALPATGLSNQRKHAVVDVHQAANLEAKVAKGPSKSPHVLGQFCMAVEHLLIDHLHLADVHLDGGMEEAQCPLSVPGGVRLDVLTHDLHVLLRHRPSSIWR
jgi:hypothetical protein